KQEMEERRLTRHPFPGTEASDKFDAPGVGFRTYQRLMQPPRMPSPLLTFDGISLATSGCGCLPPDTDGDVGPNHYIEGVNSSFAIYDKSGTLLSGPTTYNSLFLLLGPSTPCGSNQNDGDPFVLYDHIADRWLVSDFAFPSFPGSSFYQCVAIS